MHIKPIKNQKDYEQALKRIEKIFLAKKNTPESDELEILSILIEAYEAKNYPILPPDPIEAIKFRMEQMGLEQKDLGEIIGTNRASEILHGKRNLTIKMIKALHDYLNIPAESLLG